MRLRFALPVLAVAAFAFLSSASADDVPCYGVHAGSTVLGVCAGIICNDICAPQLVVHGQCSGVGGPLAALCAAYDNVRLEP